MLVLALAAIATAWSGFQASEWDDRRALMYGQASTERFEANAASTLGGQQLVADSAMFNSWLEARAAGNAELEMVFVPPLHPRLPTSLRCVAEDRPAQQSICATWTGLYARIQQSKLGKGRSTQHRGFRKVSTREQRQARLP